MTDSNKTGNVALRIRHFIYAVLLIVLDQVTKYIVRDTLADGRIVPLWPKVFSFTFVQNTGAVWGMGSEKAGSVIFLTIITLIILAVILFVYFRIPADKKYAPLQVLIMFIIAGAIGNLIDRIAFNYVTDFLYFQLIDFPVFNVADCYITVACFVLVILILTKYRDDEFTFLSLKSKKKTEDKK